MHFNILFTMALSLHLVLHNKQCPFKLFGQNLDQKQMIYYIAKMNYIRHRWEETNCLYHYGIVGIQVEVLFQSCYVEY